MSEPNKTSDDDSRQPSPHELRVKRRVDFQQSVDLDEFKAERKVRLRGFQNKRDEAVKAGASPDEAKAEFDRNWALRNDQANATYSEGTTFQDLKADIRARKHDQYMKELRESKGDDYLVKATTLDKENRPEVGGYVARASELEGKTSEQIGRSLGVRDMEAKGATEGIRLQRLDNVPSDKLQYKDLSSMPEGEPQAGNRTKKEGDKNYPPGFGQPVNQWKLNENVKVSSSTELPPGQRFQRSDLSPSRDRAALSPSPPSRDARSETPATESPSKGKSR